MNLYNKDIGIFETRLKQFENTNLNLIELADYDNEKERDLLRLLIKGYLESDSLNMLEELHRLCECEYIFNKIWSLDRNEFYKNVITFDLNSVYGSSFIHEFVKQIQYGNIDYFDDLVGICSIKFFKTSQKAEEYFDRFIENAKHIPGLDITKTSQQKEMFKRIFEKHRLPSIM